jgi:hypothetical protein
VPASATELVATIAKAKAALMIFFMTVLLVHGILPSVSMASFVAAA